MGLKWYLCSSVHYGTLGLSHVLLIVHVDKRRISTAILLSCRGCRRQCTCACYMHNVPEGDQLEGTMAIASQWI